MAFSQHFKYMGNFKYKCKKCNRMIDSGFAPMVTHYAECCGDSMVLTSRLLIDRIDDYSTENKDLVNLIGDILQTKRQDQIMLGGYKADVVSWSDLEAVLVTFGYNGEK